MELQGQIAIVTGAGRGTAASSCTEEIYTHVSPERQREAVELLGVSPGGR